MPSVDTVYPLVTDRLSIEPLAMRDLAAFVAYRQNSDVARYQSWDTSYSEEQAVALIDDQAGVLLPAKGEWLQLAVHSKESGQLLGDLAVHRIADEESAFELGFTMAPEHQGKGYAREAAAKLLDYLFTSAGAQKVIACTDRRNESSMRVLLALGFEAVPEKTWTEEFKGETVTVDYFEKKYREKK